MTEMATPAGPLAFAASFPADPRFAATAAEVAARLAVVAGCAEAAAAEIRVAVDAAFHEALAAHQPGGPAIDLTLRTSGASFDAIVTSGRESLLHCTRPRTT